MDRWVIWWTQQRAGASRSWCVFQYSPPTSPALSRSYSPYCATALFEKASHLLKLGQQFLAASGSVIIVFIKHLMWRQICSGLNKLLIQSYQSHITLLSLFQIQLKCVCVCVLVIDYLYAVYFHTCKTHDWSQRFLCPSYKGKVTLVTQPYNSLSAFCKPRPQHRPLSKICLPFRAQSLRLHGKGETWS